MLQRGAKNFHPLLAMGGVQDHRATRLREGQTSRAPILDDQPELSRSDANTCSLIEN